MTEQEVQAAWNQFFTVKATGIPYPELKRRPELKKLAEHYYPLVRKVANRLHQKLGSNPEVQPDELTSMGVDGLYDAVSGYDTSRATKFETYATPRVRGSMLDAIRSADWVPRLVRAKASQLDRRRQILESDVGHRLTEGEMADKMGMTVEDYRDFSKGASAPAIHSVNDLNGNENDSDKQMSIEHVEDEDSSMPAERMLRKELFSKLMGRNFTPQERTIIKLYYYEDRSMKEISDIVGLSESRVSQMHSIILKRLRQGVTRNPEFYSDIFSYVGGFRDAAPAI
jgi:RNA polymerase sigma factor for flagellar operon FliA